MSETKAFCLKINVNSWHYKLNKFVWGKHWDEERDWSTDKWKPKNINLCPYARRTLATLVFGLGLRLTVAGIKKLDLLNKIDESKVVDSISTKFDQIPPLPSVSYKTQSRIATVVKYTLLGLLVLGVAALIIYEPTLALIIGVACGIVTVVILVIYALVCVVSDWNDKRPPREYKYSPQKEYPRWNSFIKQVRETCSLTSAYIHAKHKNICPCLQRVNE